MKSLLFRLSVLAVFGAAIWMPAGAGAAVIDWTSFSNPSGTSSVSGQLIGSSITATVSGTGGSARIDAPSSIINNTYNWTGSAFTPNVTNTDFLYFENLVANSVDTWTINFSSAVENPYFHFFGLERTYSFDTPITLLSASTSSFIVSGNSITGNGFTPNNAAGTLQLSGVFTTLTVVGTGVPGLGHNRDAVRIQIGATEHIPDPPDPEDPDVSAPGMVGLFASTVLGLLMVRRRKTA